MSMIRNCKRLAAFLSTKGYAIDKSTLRIMALKEKLIPFVNSNDGGNKVTFNFDTKVINELIKRGMFDNFKVNNKQLDLVDDGIKETKGIGSVLYCPLNEAMKPVKIIGEVIEREEGKEEHRMLIYLNEEGDKIKSCVDNFFTKREIREIVK